MQRATRVFNDYVRQSRRPKAKHEQGLFAWVPVPLVAALDRADWPALVQAIAAEPPAAARAFFPNPQRGLRLSESIVHPVHNTPHGPQIVIPRPTSNGRGEVHATLELRDDALMLIGGGLVLRQCLDCGGLFWSDDNVGKLAHGHGTLARNWADLSKVPVRGAIETVPASAEQARVYPIDFGPFIDRGAEHSLRVFRRNELPLLDAAAAAPPFTREAYRQAVAKWLIRLGTDHDVNQQLTALYHAVDFAKQVASRLSGTNVPSLILLGRWLSDEVAQRKHNTWSMLDAVVMALAATARAFAYGHGAHFDAAIHNTALTLWPNAERHCPALLVWGLQWADLFFQPSQWGNS